MGNEVDILKAVSDVSNIPTLPSVVERITDLLRMPQTSAEEVGHAITMDQSLATKVLKLVNSAFYGFPGKISTITHAVVILGFSTIKNIVLTASIFEMLKYGKSGMFNFDMEKFWLHSLACGAAAQTLSKHVNYTNREECFIAGLTHDIGKVIICRYLPKEFSLIMQNLQKNNLLIYESEKQLFGATHQEVGGVIAKEWNLPPDLYHAVSYHHTPSASRDHYEITAIVHCADILVRAMDLGNGGDNKIPCISSEVWDTLGLNKKVLPSLLRDIDENYEKATVFMQI